MKGLRRYDVFLSFRGKDTRTGFTSFLNLALRQKQINVYMDTKHERAEHIDTILNKIEHAAMSVIVFSQNFADSDFCLDEVAKIVECHDKEGHKIFPLFYRVSTDAVQVPKGSFADAIDALEQAAKDKGDYKMLKKVPNWRHALSVAASYTGLVWTDYRDDAEFVTEIVEAVSKKLCEMSLNSISKNLVGMEPWISKIQELLDIGRLNTWIICLWGVGGYGKTTIAKEAFKQFSPSFENSYFLENVTEKYSKTSSTEALKLELYSGLLRDNFKSSMDLENENIKARISRTRVFIVLDDVDDSIHLRELLLGGCDTFASGSKIIVTSRNNVFGKIAARTIQVEGLNDNESLQLFSLYAFGVKNPPLNRYDESKEVTRYCQNNPLALKVLGSSMNCRSDDKDWESLLNGLRDMKIKGFHEALKVSYDRLSEDEQKLFLDIACFFRGEDRDYVTKILDVYYRRSAFIKTTHLIERALVTVSDSNKLEMHDLMRKMAHDIIEDESTSNSRKGTRLWKPDDINMVLRRKTKGIDRVEGIFLDLSKTEKICLDPDVFEPMDNLRLLKFYDPTLQLFYDDFPDTRKHECSSDGRSSRVHRVFSWFQAHVPAIYMPHLSQGEVECMEHIVSFHDGLQSLPDGLHYLYWYKFPLKSLPSSFSASKLVELNLPYSNVRKLWTGYLNLPELRRIDLRHSKLLTEIPDLSKAANVERINLEGCESLKQLHSSVQDLTKLEYLNLSKCSRLGSLPSKFMTERLRILDLSHCLKVTRCPEVLGELLVLNISWTSITELPKSFYDMNALVLLDLRGCEYICEEAKKLGERLSDNKFGLSLYRDLLDWKW